MFWENLTGGMSMSVFEIATSSCVILYSITRLHLFFDLLRFVNVDVITCN